MYHYISPLPPDADALRIGLTITPETFENHLRYLRERDYTAISLYELHDALVNGTALPPNPVILTFDDGYAGHYTNAFAILQEYDFTGTFFIITERADGNNPNHLNWRQISEMSSAGMNMETHTKSHFDLRERDYDFIVYQVHGSIESIEAHTGRNTRMLAYPAGRYDDTTLNNLETLTVWRAVTTQTGMYHTTDNYFEVTRLRVSGDTGVPGLDYLLNSDR